MNQISPQHFEGVWSAAPTPFTTDWQIDVASVQRMIEHHVRLGMQGIFLGGTCGEGAWMRDSDRVQLLQTAVEASAGRLKVAYQVTDNSANRMLDHVATAKEYGADLVVIAPPHFVMNANSKTLKELYLKAIRNSELPVCFYDLGPNRALSPAIELLAEIYAEPNVVAVKDSSSDMSRREVALKARSQRPELRLLAGNEFRAAEYLQAGYDSVMLGGAAFHGLLARQILGAVKAGDNERADALQIRMNQLMYAVYGGEKIECWLSGEKKMMIELGIFENWNNYPNYPLTQECIAAIETAVREESAILLPQTASLAA